jgi:hypothetical protein
MIYLFGRGCWKINMGHQTGLEDEPWFMSMWWKEWMYLEEVVGSNRFKQRVLRKVGNVRKTSSW